MSFIQVQQSLVTHRKTLRLARLLSLDRYAVVGRLVALWAWCLDNALDGALGSDIDAEVLADVMGFDERQGKPPELLEALLTAGFLDLDPADGRLHIHDWHEHMGRLIEKREADAERQRRHRAQSRAIPAEPDVTSDDAAGDAAGDIRVTSRGRHADVTRQSRVEQSRVEQSITTSEGGSPSERTHAHDDAPLGAADAALAPPPTPPTRKTGSKPAAPQAKVTPLRTPAARIPDPVWDACIAAMGAPPSNHVERGKWAKGIVGLKESLTAGLPPGMTTITAEAAAEICVRSRRYRARYGANVPLNPMALAGNWTALATDIQPEEGKHHGRFNSFNSSPQQRFGGRGTATAGRSSGGRADGRPAIGTPAYYARAAAAAAQGGHTHAGGASGQGGGATAIGQAIGEW